MPVNPGPHALVPQATRLSLVAKAKAVLQEAQEEEAASRALAMLHLQLGPVGPSRGPKGPPLPSNISGRQADSEQGAPGSRLEHRHSSQT